MPNSKYHPKCTNKYKGDGKSRQKLTVVSLSHDFKVIPNLCATLLSCSLTSITFFCTQLEVWKYYDEYFWKYVSVRP